MLNLETNKLTKILSEYWGHSGLRRYLVNTGWMFFGQAITLLVSFFIGTWVARFLGPENYGRINYIVSFAGLFSFISGFGVDAILNRELIKTPALKDKLMGAAFLLKLVGSLVTIIVVNLVSLTTGDTKNLRVLIFLFSLTFAMQAFGVIGSYFQSNVLAKRNVQIQFVVTSVSILSKVLLILNHATVTGFILVYLLEAAVSAVSMYFMYTKYVSPLSWKIDRQIVWQLFKNGLPMMLTIVATSIYLRIDQVIIKHLLSESAVGMYAVGVKLSEVWYFFPSILTSSLLPAIINAKNSNLTSYRNRASRFYYLMVILSLAIAIPTFILAPYLITLLFGKAYLLAVPVLRVYIWSLLPTFIMAVTVQILLAENFTYVMFIVSIVGAVSNILLNILLIPRYGISGSAFATLLSYMIPLFFLVLFPQVRRVFGRIIFRRLNEQIL